MLRWITWVAAAMLAAVALGVVCAPGGQAARSAQPAEDPFAPPAHDTAKPEKPAKSPPANTDAAPATRAERPTARASQKPKPPIKFRTTNKEIEEALDQRGSAEFIDIPLRDVLDFFQEKYRVQIVLDKPALEEAKVGPDSPVTINLRDVRFRSALTLTLQTLRLDWLVRDDVLLVTTAEQAEGMLTAQVYPVADLVTYRDEKDELWDDYDTLVELITSTVVPNSWDTVGGPGSIMGNTFGGAKVLVVSQTRQGHEGVADLLAQLRQSAPKNKDQQPPRRSRPTTPKLQPFVGPPPVVGDNGAKDKTPGGMGGFFNLDKR